MFRGLPTALLVCLSLCFLFSACYKTNIDPEDIPIERYDQGVVIANFGGQSVGSFTYYDREAKKVIDDLYKDQNDGRSIGGAIQSFTRFQERGYAIIGDRIEVISLETFRSIKTITGFDMPRHFLPITSDKAYVSDWGDGFSGSVKVIDLNEGKVIRTIDTQTKGPERMVRRGNNVYVANSGGFISDDRVTLIDVSKDEVSRQITVGVDPIELQVDNDGNIWVLAKGIIDTNNPENSKKGRLSKINGYRVEFNLELSNTANSLTINKSKDILFFVMDGWVREFPVAATQLSDTPFIDRFFLRVDIDPKTDQLYCSDPKNYNNNGEVFIYNMAGDEVNNFKAGVVPGAFTFD